MAANERSSSGLFSGLVVLTVGVLLLLHNYHGLTISQVVWRWWPLLLIFWGTIKLYERTAARRIGGSGGWITGTEVFLVVGMLALLFAVAGIDRLHSIDSDNWGSNIGGDSYTFDLDMAPKPVAPDAHILIRNGKGDIAIRTSDTPEIRVSGKKSIKSWSKSSADHMAEPIAVSVTQDGDTYQVAPIGYDTGDGRISVDMEIIVPKKATVSVESGKGDVTTSDLATDVSIRSRGGRIEVNDNHGSVNVDMREGDIKVSDTKGDVKISGKGDGVEVVNASGGLTLDGEFFGPITTDKIAGGVRFVSKRTDLTLTQLNGHMETSSGNFEIVDSQGNLALRTKEYSISTENVTGKISIDNRNGDVTVRFSEPPKQDVEISNASAGITLTMPSSSSFSIQADCRSCSIDSEFTGDNLKIINLSKDNSTLQGTFGNGRGPKITLKTSYDGIEIRKTS